MRCDQCEALMINGVYRHETGCKYAKGNWQWDDYNQCLRLYVDCHICGCEVEVGTCCDCQETYEHLTEDE